MESDSIMINKFKNIKRKSCNSIIKVKCVIHIILFLLYIILIIFFIFNIIDNKKLLKQILFYVNSNINDASLFSKTYKVKNIKNRINLLKNNDK